MLFILIGTFNGSDYIQQQIKSIQVQIFHYDWRLLIRDDVSSDDTLKKIKAIEGKDERIKLVSDYLGRLGPAGNYGALMQYAYESGADHIMLADQDDVWLPNKIHDQMSLMTRLEKESPLKPILVHSDLIVVDEKLQEIHPSFMTYQGIHNESNDRLPVLLVQNFVTGCASLLNRSLVKLVLPIPGDILMHDWWIALCAAACGRIGYVPRPTVLYRQHSGNCIGAKGFWTSLNPLRTAWLNRRRMGIEHLKKTFLQSQRLSQRLASRGIIDHQGKLECIENYAYLMDVSPLRRVQVIRNLGVRRQNKFLQILLYLHLSFLRGG